MLFFELFFVLFFFVVVLLVVVSFAGALLIATCPSVVRVAVVSPLVAVSALSPAIIVEPGGTLAVVALTAVPAGAARPCGAEAAAAGLAVTVALLGVSVRSSAAAGTEELTVEVTGAEPATMVPVTSLLVVLIGLCTFAGWPGGGGAVPVPVRSIEGTGVTRTVELTGAGPAMTVGATSGVVGEMAAALRSVPLMTGMFDVAVAAGVELAGGMVGVRAPARPAAAGGSLGRPTILAGSAFRLPKMRMERREGVAVVAVAAVALLLPGVPTTFARSV